MALRDVKREDAWESESCQPWQSKARTATNAIRARFGHSTRLGPASRTQARGASHSVARAQRLQLRADCAEDGPDDAAEEEKSHNRNDCD